MPASPHELFDRALMASNDPAEFAALFEEPGMDANMVSPITGWPLIVHLLTNCRDNQLPAVLAVLVRKHVDLRLELNSMSIPLGAAAKSAKKLAYDFLLLHTDKALINRPMHVPVLLAATETAQNIENTLLILKDLLEVQNADIDIRNNIGNTALSNATRFMQPKLINYLLAKKANIWLGRELPLFTAFMTWYPLIHSYPPIHDAQSPEEALEKTLTRYETCFKALANATHNYFYHFAARYEGSPEELQSEFIAWENYIMSPVNSRVAVDGNPYFGRKFRNILRQDIFKSVLDRIQFEKTQRLPVCWGFHKLAKTCQSHDNNLISEVFSYLTAASPRSLSFQEKWQAALQQTLLKINMAPGKHNKGVWYSLDYRKFMDTPMYSYDEKSAEGYANNEYWKMTTPFVFKIKADVLPVTALKAFLTGLTIADCGSVLVACQYAALLKIIGVRKFNIMFAAEAAPLTISRFIHDPDNPITYFFTRSEKPVTTGDMCYLGGLEFFSKKHPLGHARGWSVVCTGQNSCGENLYYGFGSDNFKVSSMAEKDLAQIMINIYNLPRDKYNQKWIEAQTSAEQYDLARQNIPAQLTYTEAMSALQGYEPNSTVTPDYAKISDYQQKITLTADEFIADYDNSLRAGNYPSFFSRPTSMTIELPDVPADEKSQSPSTSPRVGIPTFRY